MAQVKFYSVTSLPDSSSINAGGIYFVDGGELYKGAQRFGLGRVTNASTADALAALKAGAARGDINVGYQGAKVYDGENWQPLGGDTAALQGSWRADISDWVSGLVTGSASGSDSTTYITNITKDADGKVTAHSADFANAVKGAVGNGFSWSEGGGVTVSVTTTSGSVTAVSVAVTDINCNSVTAGSATFTDLTVTSSASFTATEVVAGSLTVGGKTVEQIADKQIAAISATTKSAESNGVTVNVTTEAGSVKTVAVTTTPVEAITTSSVGSDTVVSEKAVKAYVDGKFKALDNAMHFKGVVTALPTENNKDGDIVVIGAGATGEGLVQGQEYIWNGTSWELIGDQNTYAVNAYAPGSEKVTSGAQTLPSAIHAVAAAVDTLNGEGEGSVKKALVDAKAYTDGKIADLDSTASGGTQGVEISVGQTDGKLDANATVTITKSTLNNTLGTTNVADKTIATLIGVTGVDTALATEKAVRDAITSAELVWLDENGKAI